MLRVRTGCKVGATLSHLTCLLSAVLRKTPRVSFAHLQHSSGNVRLTTVSATLAPGDRSNKRLERELSAALPSLSKFWCECLRARLNYKSLAGG